MAEREARPSPEALLDAAKQEGRGRLKIFLGAAPGVGKTYEMLLSAQAKRREGIDIVIALDVSGSMRTEDFRPKNRLLVAKDVVGKFIRGRRNDLIGLVAFAVASAWMLHPILYYVEHRRVQEWMIYRFLVSQVLGTIAALMLGASYLTAKIVKITRPVGEARSRLLTSRLFWLIPGVCFLAGGALVLASFLELLRTGETYEHWSRFVAMSFFWSIGSIFAVTRIMDYVLDLLAAQLAYDRQTGRRRRDDPPAV